jgi:hypothetical protein
MPALFRFFNATDHGRAEKRPFLRCFSRGGEFFQNTYTGFLRVFLLCLDRECSFSSGNKGIFGNDFFPSVFPDSPIMPQARSLFRDDHLVARHLMASH